MRNAALLLILITLIACNAKKETTVEYRLIPFYTGKLYLERLPVGDERVVAVDSSIVEYNTERIQLHIPEGPEALYQLRVEGKPLRIYLINDVDEVIVVADNSDPKNYHFSNDGYNKTLKKFKDSVDGLDREVIRLNGQFANVDGPVKQSLLAKMDSIKQEINLLAQRFCDTTSHPAAFQFAYNRVDFGKDRTALKNFVARAAKRFQGHKGIADLMDATLAYVSIFETELAVGEKFPQVSLPDTSGWSGNHMQTGTYVFYDIWSGWCAPCLQYIPVKRELARKFPGLQIVNVAMDTEPDAWRAFIRQQQLPGYHMIDQGIWRGKAAAAWKFDSIPFNFLVSPDGVILAKAIKPDSVMQVVTKFVR